MIIFSKMFDYKYEIVLQNNSTYRLFGEDYFADKSTFWNAHQSALNSLYDGVIESGFPIKIIDLEHDKDLVIDTLEAFHSWLKSNQPFNFNRVDKNGL